MSVMNTLLLRCCILPIAWLLATGPGQSQTPERESIEIGLSTDVISITADFSGADLTIFGALDNADPLVLRQARYDIVVVLEGPEAPVTSREKRRQFGMWVNGSQQTYSAVPTSYSISTTKTFRDITDEKTYRQLLLGIPNIQIKPSDEGEPIVEELANAVRDIRRDNGLYNERVGDVVFLSRNLFRATLTIPANVPTGRHKARAFLFRAGQFMTETSTLLEIRKSGFEQALSTFAHEQGFLFGLMAVLVAIITGWLGRLLFRRD
jgi:uncharacterized protein (TIGR02186 family)